MAKYSFNRPVQKNGKLTDYAKMLLEIHEDGAIEIVETRRRMKYMTYQHMFEFGLIDSIKQHGSRRHQYELTQSGVDLVNQILRTQRTPVVSDKIEVGDIIKILRKGSNWNPEGQMDHLVGTKQKVVGLSGSYFSITGNADYRTWSLNPLDVEKCNPVSKKKLTKVRPADVIANLKLQLKEAEANLAKEQEDSESTKLEKHRELIKNSTKVKIKESYRGKYVSLNRFPLHIFRIAEDGLAKCAISNSGSELTFNIHFKYLNPINIDIQEEMFKAI